MNTKTLSMQLVRKRKFFLILPLLVLPFITMLFWALGGGKDSGAQAQEKIDREGLNVELPEAYLKDEGALNKLSYYEKAASDSAKLEELMKNDPYYLAYRRAQQDGQFPDDDTTLQLRSLKQSSSGEWGRINTSPYRSNAYTDPNEAKVYEKLDEINTAMNASTAKVNQKAANHESYPVKRTVVSSADIDRLEQMMDQTKSGVGEDDPEIRQLNEMMEKIIDIQHPERVKVRNKEGSIPQKEAALPVQVKQPTVSITLLGGDSMIRGADESFARFYGLEDDQQGIGAQSSVLASVHGTQTLRSGSVIKLRLEQNIYIGGELIPHGTFMYGTAAMNSERLHIMIATIRSGMSILPVKLKVYDLDGLEGIYMPGSVQREVLKGSTDNAMQGLELSTLDPTLKAQATSAGISAVKNLLSRRVKVEKVTLKGGYQVILQFL